jgi:hypothetical protein
MAGKGNIKNLKPWKKGQSGNPGGRAKLTSEILQELAAKGYQPVTPQQIMDAYTTLVACSVAHLTEMAKAEDMPMYVRIISKALLSGNGTDQLEKMLDRAHGKAKQSTDITSSGQPLYQLPDFSNFTTKQLKELILASRARNSTTGKGDGG